MEIETIKQTDEKILRINNTVDVDIRTTEDNVYVRLFSRYEQRGWLVLKDFEGEEHLIDINMANAILMEYALKKEAETVMP